MRNNPRCERAEARNEPRVLQVLPLGQSLGELAALLEPPLRHCEARPPRIPQRGGGLAPISPLPADVSHVLVPCFQARLPAELRSVLEGQPPAPGSLSLTDMSGVIALQNSPAIDPEFLQYMLASEQVEFAALNATDASERAQLQQRTDELTDWRDRLGERASSKAPRVRHEAVFTAHGVSVSIIDDFTDERCHEPVLELQLPTLLASASSEPRGASSADASVAFAARCLCPRTGLWEEVVERSLLHATFSRDAPAAPLRALLTVRRRPHRSPPHTLCLRPLACSPHAVPPLLRCRAAST